MFRSYFKIALRHLVKYKLNSLINIFGLSVGIAAGIMIFLYAKNELTYDSFHENVESIYLVYKERITPTGTQITRDTWLPMAAALQNEYPMIKNAVRTWDMDRWVEFENKRFEESITCADPSLFEMFTFPLQKGNPESAFRNIYSAIISPQIAQKYFGDENPIGKAITINFETEYTIRGVLEEIPQNSTFEIDILVRPESFPWYEETLDNWSGSWLYTFIQLDKHNDAAALESQFPGFVTKIWNEELNESMNLKLLPLLDFYHELTGARTYAYILLVVALIILVIASINFMNLTTARSIERAREIGMRKVLGAYRGQLINQFLSESLIMSMIALVLGLGLVELILPYFNSFYNMSLQMDYWGNIGILLSLVGLGVGVGLFSGLYPAFYLSKFNPGDALRGSLKTSPGGLKLRLGLVITQFTLSIILIIATGLLWKQVQYMKSANLNFDEENIIAIVTDLSDFENEEKARSTLETFKNGLRQHTGIQSVSSSSHIPGRWPGWFTFVYPTDRHDSQRLRMRHCFVDAHYFETYGMTLKEGRTFSEKLATDREESVIINEAALRDMGWPNAVGHQVRVGNTVYNIVGVVEDYHFQSLASKIAPIIHRYRSPDNGAHRVISVKTNSDQSLTMLDFIKSRWQALVPANPLNYFYVERNFDRLYENEERLATVAGGFTLLAIIIACLGLFALASLMVSQRTKEIGVRKVLGASVANIVGMLSREFIKLVAIAFLLAIPLAYWLGNRLLSDFAYRTNIGWEIFILGGLLTLIIATLTVSYQSIKAALSNPVDALRYE